MKNSKQKKNEDAWRARMSIWRHNSFFGHARMMEANASSILTSATATEEAKGTALQIKILAQLLRKQLKEKVKS